MKTAQHVSFLEMEQELYSLNPTREGFGVQDEYLRSDGSGREFLRATHGGSANAITQESLKDQSQFVFQDGKTVFKNAVFNMADATEKNIRT